MAFSNFLQENLLVLLTFDKERCRIIRGTISTDLFGGFYRDIVTEIYNYIDKFDAPPGEHIADLFEKKLNSKDKRERRTYEDIISAIGEARETINSEYVMSQLEGFVRRQSLRSVAVDLSKALQRDTEESLEEADRLIQSAKSTSLKVFDPGVRMSNIPAVLRFLDNENEAFRTGIPEFDRRNFGPTRKELLLYIADTKTGKTWSMIHLAKIALLNGLRTVHISLEMSEDKIMQRYVQALFAISKRKEKFTVQRFNKGKRGLEGIEERVIKPKLSFDNPHIRKKLEAKLRRFEKRLLDNIIVKQFPTSQLSCDQLEAYLDNLEITEGFVPDLLIVDYPDLMKLESSGGDGMRHMLGMTYKRLRGVAVARNMALAAPTQSNREGSGAKQVGRKNVSEAYSKIADADTVLTYSQTDMEKALGLARLTVVAGRNDEDNISVCLSQNYGMGQYAVDSILMEKKYWDLIEAEDPGTDEGDYDDDD